MRAKKSFSELEFSDAFMFAATMEDEEICRGVLERVLGIPIKKVHVRTEQTLLVNSDYRGIRMDVFADDEEGTVYNVEMQTTDKKNLPKRSRVYQGQLDMAALRPGDDFGKLPRTFIIFICTFDPVGAGLYRYTYDMRCRETGESLEDGTFRVFLNTKGRNREGVSPELVRFLTYVEDSSCGKEGNEDLLIEQIERRITSLKRDRGKEVSYMLFGEMLDDERKEGRESILKLISLMAADGDTDKIPFLSNDPEFYREMCKKYHIEAGN